MSKAKANTDQQKHLASTKQSELDASRRRDAELEIWRRKEEDEMRRKDMEARLKRERDARELDLQMAAEREKKRLGRLKVGLYCARSPCGTSSSSVQVHFFLKSLGRTS